MKRIILVSLLLAGCSSAGRELQACRGDDCIKVYKYSTVEYCHSARELLQDHFPPESLVCK